MNIEEINNKIQAERNRHQQKINNLKAEITKENEHSRRTIEYLQNQKQQATKQNKQEEFKQKSRAKLILEQLTKFD